MLRELTKADWLSILNIPAERIPKVLILRGTRNLKTYYAQYRDLFDNVLDVGSPNGVLEDLLIGDLHGQTVAFACVYGANMASEIVHVFGVLGTRLVIQTGNCGALQDGIQAGDLFVATEAYCGEGAAQYYKTNGTTVSAHYNSTAQSIIAQISDLSVFHGRIYTTSALFAEGEREIEQWHGQGFAAVDMETATTFAVAEYFNMDRMSILYGFDNPRQKDHILLTDTDKDLRRAAGNRRMIETALQIADCYNTILAAY
jgi:uridine phosphorylase